MMDPALEAHLAGGLTTVCHCWSIERSDGMVLGFTDHDNDLAFDGVDFAADTGLTARAIERDAGLSVDNSEAVGAFSAASLDPDDIKAGRYDGARVSCWLVNWSDIDQRHTLFAGHLGEITHNGQVFQAELRGLSERLNQDQGRQYRPTCGAVLGDGACGFDVTAPGFSGDGVINTVADREVRRITGLDSVSEAWFSRGRIEKISGAGAQLAGWIEADTLDSNDRILTR